MVIITKDLNTIRDNILVNITQNIDEINDINVGSALDMFVTALAYELEQGYNALDIVYNGFHIDTAVDYDLDQLGALVGVERFEGSEAEGIITFMRNDAASSEFTIPSGSIVSTQPDSNSDVLSYTTSEDVTFTTSESVDLTFRDGIFEYKLNNRDFTDIVITIDGSSFTDFEKTSYDGEIIDTDSITIINDCESTTDWTALNGADDTATNSTSIEGSNSLELLKSDTTTSLIGYRYPFSSIDFNGNSLCVSLSFAESLLTSDLSQIDIVIGSGYNDGSGNTNNNYTWTITDFDDFTPDEFKRLFLDIEDATVNNIPNITEIDFVEIYLTTSSDSITIESGDALMDFWFNCEYEDYNGYILQLSKETAPSDDSTMSVSYKPLAVDVLVVSNDIGTEYNVGVGQITYLTSVISNIDSVYNYESMSGGSGVESNEDYRARVKKGGYAGAYASQNAIVENVKALDYVQDTIVIDMPTKTISDEAHVYDDTSQKIRVDNKVLLDNSNLVISDSSGGSADYTNGTDYEVTDYNTIDFSIGGSEPSDGSTIYISYEYEALGEFTVIVYGSTGYLTNEQINDIETLVDNIKSPGVISTVNQATRVNIDVSGELLIDDGYDTTSVKESVQKSIESYITDLNIGDDVYLSKVTKAITSVEGVIDVSNQEINNSANNYTIEQSEKAVPNNITLTES